MSDFDLLRQYARENSQPAFAALVERHLALVYTAALRQVRSPALAEDVAQSVFTDLARRAANIGAQRPLAAWLYAVTRRTAIDALRRESRRLARETAAAEIAAMKTPSPTWAKVEDAIDEAMAALNETDRTAVVLRFFQNHSLREVGEALGVSDDTAQKRVSRALERLRTLLGRRGVAVTAAGLATDLSAQAVHAAPTGLSAAISSSAAFSGVALGHAALGTTGTTLAMTTVKKVLVATAVAAALTAASIR